MSKYLLGRSTALSAAATGLLAFPLLAMPSYADQVPIEFDVCQGPGPYCGSIGTNGTYSGPAEDSQISGSSSAIGGVREASATNNVVGDAYDGYGALYGVPTGEDVSGTGYILPFNGLTGTRQTETYATQTALPDNSIRWFDSFTNDTASPIDMRLAFGGNLGSDSGTEVLYQGSTWIVTGQSPYSGSISTDPVIAHLYGNNSFAENAQVVDYNGNPFAASSSKNNIFFQYPELIVQPGETVSWMHVNILFGDETRDTDPNSYAADALLAQQAAELFINSPVFDGLTADQVASLLNWNVQGTTPTLGDEETSIGTGPIAASQAFLNYFLFAGPRGGPTGGNTAEPLAFGPEKKMDKRFEAVYNADLVQSYVQQPARYAVYAVGGGAFGEVGSTDYATGFGGIGAETYFDAFTFGGAVAYSAASADNGVDSDSEGVIGSVYAGYDAGSGFVGRLALSYGRFDVDYSRQAGALTARGDTDANVFGAGALAGYRFETAIASLMPYAALTYSYADYDGYTETGAGAANLTVPDFNLSGVTVETGVRASRNVGIANLYAGLGYAYSDGDSDTIQTSFAGGATTAASTLTGFANGSALTLEAGAEASFTQNLSGSIGYKGYISDDPAHTFDASLKFRF